MSIITGLAGEGAVLVPYYVHDDFGDDAITDRSDVDEGLYMPSGYRSSDIMLGRYRPSWGVDALNVTPSATNGRVVCDGSSGSGTNYRLRVFSEIVYGRWLATFANQEQPSSGFLDLCIKRPRETHANQLAWRNSVTRGRSGLIHTNDGTVSQFLSTGSSYADTSEHTVEVTRDRTSTWSVTIDGVAEGTTQNTTTIGNGYTTLAAGGGSGYDATHEWREVRVE